MIGARGVNTMFIGNDFPKLERKKNYKIVYISINERNEIYVRTRREMEKKVGVTKETVWNLCKFFQDRPIK